MWDLNYTTKCHKETGNPHVWFLNIVIFGYFLFPFFSSLMKRHIKPLRLIVVAMLLFWIEIDGGMRWIRWMVSTCSICICVLLTYINPMRCHYILFNCHFISKGTKSLHSRDTCNGYPGFIPTYTYTRIFIGCTGGNLRSKTRR